LLRFASKHNKNTFLSLAHTRIEGGKLNCWVNMSLEFDVSLDSEQEENPEEDGDTVKNIQEVFRQQFNVAYQESASLKSRRYITHATSSSDFSKIAIGIDKELIVYDITTSGLSKYVGKSDFGKFDHPISGIKFLNQDNNLILASTIAGEIHMYDLRNFKKVFTFEGNVTAHFTNRAGKT
jgi:WD40 repeat protein